MRNYYVLTYVPSNDVFDGKFRTIKVNVKRGGIDVASRKGYFAVRAPGAQPVRTFEAPALAMLDVTPVPNAFPVRAVAVKFPERDRPGLVPVLVSLSASNITFVPSEDKLNQHADFTVLVRFRDQANEIVRKLSQHYQFDGPADKVEAMKQGRSALLPADRTAAGRLHDGDRRVRRGEQSRERALLDRGAAQGGRRWPAREQPAAGRPERDGWPRPIAPPTTRSWSATCCCIRTSARRCRRREAKELAFFFTIYPGSAAKPTAVLELMQNGKLLAQSPLPLERGRRQRPDPAGGPAAAGRTGARARTTCAWSSPTARRRNWDRCW